MTVHQLSLRRRGVVGAMSTPGVGGKDEGKSTLYFFAAQVWRNPNRPLVTGCTLGEMKQAHFEKLARARSGEFGR